MRTTLTCLVLSTLLCNTSSAQELVGFAKLPADTFRDGPTSGQFIDPAAETYGVTPPFVDKQPVQGISSIVAGDEEGTYLALSDNGFGTKANSADYLLCVYKVTPDWEAKTVDWELAFHLSDPNGHVPWPIVADGETYPNSDIPVPAIIRENRLLTGADFDVESMVRLPDGTFWLGDEFGPFLLHFDAEGRLLEQPLELPGEGMHSPDHPTKDPATAKIGRSSGFEAMLGRTFWETALPLLEQPLESSTDVAGFVLIPTGRAITLLGDGKTEKMAWASNLVARGALHFDIGEATAIGEAVLVATEPPPDASRGMVSRISIAAIAVERDNDQGDAAKIKRLTLHAAFRTQFGDWSMDKPVHAADLLNLPDPHDLDGDGGDVFRFPFLTIESLLPIDDRTVLVVNDNNYPFTSGRGGGEPDNTEFILIRFDKPLAELGK